MLYRLLRARAATPKPPRARIESELGSGTGDVVVAVTALRLSRAKIELAVSTTLSKDPENEANPSPFGKLPGGTEEVNTDVPTRVEPEYACSVNDPEGPKAVAKLKDTLDKPEENATFTGPVWGGLQKS